MFYNVLVSPFFLNPDLSRSGAVPKLERNWPDLGENWSLDAGSTFLLLSIFISQAHSFEPFESFDAELKFNLHSKLFYFDCKHEQ